MLSNCIALVVGHWL